MNPLYFCIAMFFAFIIMMVITQGFPKKVKLTSTGRDLNDPYDNEYLTISGEIDKARTSLQATDLITKILGFENKYKNRGNRNAFVVECDRSRLLGLLEEQIKKLSDPVASLSL